MTFDDLNLNLIHKDKQVVIFTAKEVITMDHSKPLARALAVQDGIIVGVGDERVMTALLERCKLKYEINSTFEQAYIYPGFSEHHMHPQIMGASLLNSHYIGYNDRLDGKGGILPGIKSKDELIARLHELYKEDEKALQSGEQKWLNCWGIDPLLLGNVEFNRDVLDKITKDFPICLSHASGHVINLNSAAIALAGYDALLDTNDPNLPRFKDGRVKGTICEPPLMSKAFAVGAAQVDYSVEGLIKASCLATKIARMKGCTSITDKGTNIMITPGHNASDAWIKAHEKGLLHTRVNMEVFHSSVDEWEFEGLYGWQAIHALRAKCYKRLSVGAIKMLTDGSIQGFTAHMLPHQPYATPGHENGVLQMSVEEIAKNVQMAEENAFAVSIHTNGNGATEAAIQAIEQIRSKTPDLGFRHSLEHNQLCTDDQFARMKKAGITTNLFANHIYFWGEVHAKYTVGEHLARRMDACRTATDTGLIHGIHSDDMVTEVGPLFSAWCAANRITLAGRVLGPSQCLSVDEAMRVITYNHAWMAHQEDVRGSLEVGKWADFTALASKPRETEKHLLKDIKIVGSVIGGDDIFIN